MVSNVNSIISLAFIIIGAQAQHGHHATSYATVTRQDSHQGIHGLVHATLPVAVHTQLTGHVQHEEHHHHHPKYAFKYGVEDKHTGDIKSQEETRDGDVVKGSYSLHEPDGTILIVHYTADKHSGFNAVVERKGHATHPQLVKHQQY